MELVLSQLLTGIPLAAEEAASEEGGSFLVTPGLGLMIWTLAVFGFTLWVLSKFAFPLIAEALDKRAKVINESIDSAERQRDEADKLLADYRQRLTEAREQADTNTEGEATNWCDSPFICIKKFAFVSNGLR